MGLGTEFFISTRLGLEHLLVIGLFAALLLLVILVPDAVYQTVLEGGYGIFLGVVAAMLIIFIVELSLASMTFRRRQW